ncbi:CHC2 zinc finger domain-containing protein [Flavobacterium sp.]|uniref:CHC2 zinc finger domain-containing protein n=1 Tax=Flavobacterium sp. TaxID=239 RepID=UPI003529A92D
MKLNDLPKSNISSPFTEDKNPSFQVFKNGSFKCYSSEKSGDCFQLVAELNSLDCKKI